MKAKLESAVAFLLAVMEWAEAEGEAHAKRLLGAWQPNTRFGRATKAQTSSVLTVVVVGIVIIIGILVYAEIESALPTAASNDLQDASDNATGTFGDAMELAPVILLVLIASVILAVVQRFR